MEDKLIEYDTAKLAQVVGFNESCDNYFDLLCESNKLQYFEFADNINPKDGFPAIICLQPTQSALQAWLRTTHDINVYVSVGWHNARFIYEVEVIWFNLGDGMFTEYTPDLSKWTKGDKYANTSYEDTWEEALEVGLVYGLNILKERLNKNTI